MSPSGSALSVADLAPIRASIVAAQGALDDLRVVAADALSPDPDFTAEAQRSDIERHGAALRGHLRDARERADASSTSVLGVVRDALTSAAVGARALVLEVELPCDATAADVERLGAAVRRDLVTAAEEIDALAELLRRHEGQREQLERERAEEEAHTRAALLPPPREEPGHA